MALLCACVVAAYACVSVCIMHARVCAHDAISCKVINIIVITALFRPKEHLKNENIPTFNIFPVFFVCDQFFYYICTQTVSYLRKESKGNSVKVRNSTRCCEFHLRIAPCLWGRSAGSIWCTKPLIVWGVVAFGVTHAWRLGRRIVWNKSEDLPSKCLNCACE